MHTEPGQTLGAMHGLFAGARACGLWLHHKELNTWGRIPCAEYAWVSAVHAQRVVAALASAVPRDGAA